MAIDLLGQNVVKHGHLEIWAQRGLIRVLDTRDGSTEILSVRTSLERMLAIQEMVTNVSKAGRTSSRHRREKGSHDQFDQANVDRIQSMLEGMTRLCRRAQEQGMPSDPQARRDLARRRARTFAVPTALSQL